ncbi:transmembrane protein 238 [Saccopteryx bilineata]|uniref:transmembrane protein 238 n=1 Tax=Saccopteryx bilineata TaxID=59482 RepID=UPI00338D3DED
MPCLHYSVPNVDHVLLPLLGVPAPGGACMRNPQALHGNPGLDPEPRARMTWLPQGTPGAVPDPAPGRAAPGKLPDGSHRGEEAGAMAAAPVASASPGPSPGTPSPPTSAPAPASGLGRCRMALLLAVALDVAGMAALLTGVFAQLQVRGRDFGDLLIYSGALLVFLSLLGWILWYTGNIEISRQELERDYGLRPSALARLARKLSRRWSAPAASSAAGTRGARGSRGARRGVRTALPPGAGSRRVRLQLVTLEAAPAAPGAGGTE